jgi:hypothetical protein
MNSKLLSDLTSRRVLPAAPLKPFISSPLGFVPKHDSGFRRIHNLSAPRGRSTNDGIPLEYRSIIFPVIEDVFRTVLEAGRGCIIVKKDIKDAFRMVPVARSDQWLLGFSWEGAFYRETCLPFGLATAPFLFNLFAEGLHWILESFPAFGVQWLLHYLDDFIFAFTAGDPQRVERFHTYYAQLTDYLGIPRNDAKDQEGTCVTVLGFEIDSLRFTARLPADKLEKAFLATASALAQKSLSREEAESLAGFLTFCSKVVILGRVHMRYIWTFVAVYPPGAVKSCRRRIPPIVRQDLEWWHTLLPRFNGIMLFNSAEREQIQLFTDASALGMGGFWYSGPIDVKSWKPHLTELYASQAFAARVKHDQDTIFDVNVFELGAILLAFEQQAVSWRGKRICTHTDSAISQLGLEHHTLKGAANAVLRRILIIAAEFDIEITPIWLPGDENELADAISRFKSVANWCPQWGDLDSLLLRQHGYTQRELTLLL